jgi:hypothetical protein
MEWAGGKPTWCAIRGTWEIQTLSFPSGRWLIWGYALHKKWWNSRISVRLNIVGVPWRLTEATGFGEHVVDILRLDNVFGAGYVHSKFFPVQLSHAGWVSWHCGIVSLAHLLTGCDRPWSSSFCNWNTPVWTSCAPFSVFVVIKPPRQVTVRLGTPRDTESRIRDAFWESCFYLTEFFAFSPWVVRIRERNSRNQPLTRLCHAGVGLRKGAYSPRSYLILPIGLGSASFHSLRTDSSRYCMRYFL